LTRRSSRTAGGGRISLNARPIKYSAQDLQPAANGTARLQITTNFGPAQSTTKAAAGLNAFRELGIASSPTRFDGKTFDDIALTLNINGTPVEVTLAASETAANTSIDQLVTQLQEAVNDALEWEGFDADDIIVKRAEIQGPPNGNGDALVIKGNRIVFEANEEVVNELSILVPEYGNPSDGIQAQRSPNWGLLPLARARPSGARPLSSSWRMSISGAISGCLPMT
jgi:hypothetical protein